MANPVAPQTIIVPANQSPVRLDVFLVSHTDLSRTKIQQHIKAGDITVTGKIWPAHHLVHPGYEIIINNFTEPVHQEAKTINAAEPTILDEDNNYLVVNKPSGLLVHGGPGIHESTLADWAVKHDPSIAQVGDQPESRPGIIHRLDREVSGAMVIAKTQIAFDDLKGQFKNHEVNKQYLALVYGRITDQTGRIDFAIARKPDKSGLMVARPKSTEGKDAETAFHVERYVKNMTLVKVRTMTGRMHQIRVHFKAIGHPLIGDPLYKIKRMKVQKLPPPRLFLHAQFLAFTDLTGKQRQYQAPLPADLAQFLARIS